MTELIHRTFLSEHTILTDDWHWVDDGRIQCDVCPRACKLQEGQQGLCFVRAREQDAIVLTSYGRSSGFCIDPIEKKPLNHFYPGSSVLSFGTAGCNLACKFCQNWDMSKSREINTLAQKASPNVIADACVKTKCESIAFTYNDPVIFYEYAIDCAQACRDVGVKSVAVTAGYMCDAPRRQFFNTIDAVNVDLKAFTENFYWKICGAKLGNVLETIQYIHEESNAWMELTTLLIPGENDSADEISQLCQWVMDKLGPDVPLHFTAFHPDWKMLDKKPTPLKTLTDARKIALDTGLHYVYLGNVQSPGNHSTYCPTCGHAIIERNGYELGRYCLTSNRCDFCSTLIPGHFHVKKPDISWGNKRQVIRFSE